MFHRIVVLVAICFTAGVLNSARADVVDLYIKDLKSKDVEVRRKATYQLGERGAAAKKAIPALIEVLNDSDEQVKRNAFHALGEMGAEATEAIPALVQSLQKEKEPEMRKFAAQMLGKIGADKDGKSVEALIVALKDSEVGRTAADALRRMGPAAKDAAPALRKALTSSELRGTAAAALAELGPDGVKQLQDALDDKDEEVRAIAIGGLALRPKEHVPDFTRGLKDKSVAVRREALAALRGLGKDAKDAIPGMIDVFKDDKDVTLRIGAAQALGTMGPVAKDAVGPFAEALEKDKDVDVRVAAAVALGAMGEVAKDALPALKKASTDADENVSDAAKAALKRLGEK